MVYPPVDTQFFHPGDAAPDKFALVVSALVPYKRLETAIAACIRVGIPLKVVGDGPERTALLKRVDGNTEILGRLADADVRTLYQRAAVVLLPGEEDFGIVPLEAQACGRPVVALGRGGATETILDGQTGVLVADASVDAFADAISTALASRFDAGAIRRHAESFGRERFGDEMTALVRSC